MTNLQTTHVGSLPRTSAVTDVVFAVERGEPVRADRFDAVIGPAFRGRARAARPGS